jgi:valyl-tRNA synthetase
MRMDELAKPAIEAVEDGRVIFVPDRWARVYLDWMRNIRPWTLSRQLWWGHRIPIYYCADGHATAAKSRPEACETCGGDIVRQDEDVLDTWFSSALWPFASLGWPKETEDLRRFYPTSFMNTSSQIIYLWIARMIMTGLKFMDDVPFPVVLINPTILNERGQRMSKSLGTGIDPLDLIREYGADALRYGLMTAGNTHQQEIRFSADRVEQARNFANKVWNLARAAISNQAEEEEQELRLTPADRWILSRLDRTIEAVTASLDDLELSGGGAALYDFVWAELADWYLEIAKSRLYDSSDPTARFTARAVLWSALDRVVRLLHPYMPFVTEEIWQQLRTTGSQTARDLSGWPGELPESVMIASWPVIGTPDEAAEREMSMVMDIIRKIRAVRSEYRVDPAAYISATLTAGTDLAVMEWGCDIIARLARLRPLAVHQVLDEKPRRAVAVLVGNVTVYLPIEEMTDVAVERARLEKDLAAAQAQERSVAAKLGNEKFLTGAPAQVVERERGRASEIAERVRRLHERLELLGE